jgi:uncharacterized protein (DUF58 family)
VIIISLAVFFILLIWLQRLIYSRFWQRNLEIELRFSTPTGVEGNSIMLIERLTSRKILPLPWLTVKFQVSRNLVFPDKIHAAVTDYYYREDLFSLGMYQRISRSLPVVLRKRGFYLIKSIDLLSSDLLLTVKLVGHTASSSSLTVCPRLVSRQDIDVPYRQLMGLVLTRQSLYPDPFEFRTIREYQSFDNLRSINWLATARTGQLKVNVHENTASRDVKVLLNVEPDAAFYEERLIEEAIRVAASICAYLSEDGVSCGICTNARDSVSRATVDIATGQSIQHNQQIQEQLGRLDLGQKPERFADILAGLPSARLNEHILLFVSVDCNPALCKEWAAILDQGYQGLWIVPRPKGMMVGRLPEIEAPVLTWEVNEHVA